MVYGGSQRGNARIEIDENGQQQVVYDDVDVSANNRHQSVGSAFAKTTGQLFDPRKSMLPYLLPYAMWAGGTGAAVGTGMENFVGVGGPTTPGFGVPAAAGGLPTGPLAGVLPHVGPAAIGAGAPAAVAPAAASGMAKFMANPFVSKMAGGFGEAVPSLVMSAFMGPSKEEKAQSKATLGMTEAQRKQLEQQNAFREYMRPMVQQAMQAMFGRMPIAAQGQFANGNFPQFPGAQAPPRQSPFTSPNGRNAQPRF